MDVQMQRLFTHWEETSSALLVAAWRVFQMGSNAGQNYLGAPNFLHNHIEMALLMSSVLSHS